MSRKGGDSKGHGKEAKSSKGKGKGGLERRIVNSYCRICWKKGHWKNGCPMKPGSNSGSSTTSTMSSSIPTSVVTVDDLPEELTNLETIDDTQALSQQDVLCFVAQGWVTGEMDIHNKGKSDLGNRTPGSNRPARNKLFSRFSHLAKPSLHFRKEPLSDSQARFVRDATTGDAQEHKLEMQVGSDKLPSSAMSLNELLCILRHGWCC